MADGGGGGGGFGGGNDMAAHTNTAPMFHTSGNGFHGCGGSNDLSSEKEKQVPAGYSDGSSPDVEAVEQAGAYGERLVSKEREKLITKKLDKRIVPMVMWVYLNNMIDRGEFCYRSRFLLCCHVLGR